MRHALVAWLVCAAAHAAADPLAGARRLVRAGRYADAEAAARKRLSSAKARDDARTLIGEIARETGRHEDAIAAFRDVLAKSPRHFRARIGLALALGDIGRDDEAKPLLDAFYDDWDAGLIRHDSAPDLTWAAMAVRAAGGYQDANDTFRDAVKADQKFSRANVEWGNLFLEKYAAGHAEQCFKDAIAADPADPEAHVGMVRVALEQGYDVKRAESEIGAALGINPRHAGALALRAAIALDAEDHDAAAKWAREALATNPRHVGARVALAASAWLRGDAKAYEAERAAVLGANPRASAFDHGVAEAIAKFNRYADALALEEKALALRPQGEDAYALAGLGTNLLRMGREDEGLAALRRAWERDRFNVRTYNVLQLYEEIIPRDYAFAESAHFRLRLPKARKDAIARPILDHLERAFAFYVKKYGFTPETPITVELFADPKHYAVRTVGLPGLGALGVCFGRVITSMAPSGKFNWGQVLWHEMSHVFTIGMSRARIPRWLTEGIADHETTLARPEWRRRSARELHDHLARSPMPALAAMHRAFVQAGSLDQMVLAYYYSERAVEFLDRRYGTAKVLDVARGLGAGMDLAAALRSATGVEPDALDREFRADLAKALAVYDGQFDPQNDPHAKGAPSAFEVALDAARKGNPAARRAALALLLDAVARGQEGYDVRMLAAHLAREVGEPAAEIAHLEAAARFDPEAIEPVERLAEAYAKAGRADDAFVALRRVGAMAGMDLGVQKRLLAELSRRGMKREACETGGIVLHLDPEDVEARRATGSLQSAQALVFTKELGADGHGPDRTRPIRRAWPVVICSQKRSDYAHMGGLE